MLALAGFQVLSSQLHAQEPHPEVQTGPGVAVVYKNPIAAGIFVGDDPLVIEETVAGVPYDPGLGSFTLDVSFDPSTISIVIAEGPFLGSTGRDTSCALTLVTEHELFYGCASSGPEPGPWGTGVLATLTVNPAPDLMLKPTLDNGRFTVIDNIAGGVELFDIEDHLIPLRQLLDAIVLVRALEGDLNGDCRVDIIDSQLISARYNSILGSLLYNGLFDVEPPRGDLDIDIKDLQFIFGRDGSNCETPNPPQPTPTPATTVVIPTVIAETRTPTVTATGSVTPTRTATATKTPSSGNPSSTPTRTKTSTPTPQGPGCPFTIGYWRNHEDDWNVGSLVLGDETYSKSELLDILNTATTGDASLILARQLIAAKLNVAQGFDDSIAGQIANGDILLDPYPGALPYDVSPQSNDGQWMVLVAVALDRYNSKCSSATPVSTVLGGTPPPRTPTSVNTVLSGGPRPPGSLPPTGSSGNGPPGGTLTWVLTLGSIVVGVLLVTGARLLLSRERLEDE